MRSFIKTELQDIKDFANKLLHWCSTFENVSFLNSNGNVSASYEHIDVEHSYDLMLGVDSVSSCKFNGNNAFGELKQYYTQTNDWLFGHFSYDLKNQIEKLTSNNFDGIQFPEMYFFQPRYLFLLKGNHLQVGYLKQYSTEVQMRELIKTISSQPATANHQPVTCSVNSRITKEKYISGVNSIKKHIRRGDIYEMNFCMEFFAEQAILDPVQTYLSLNEVSQTPFSAFYKIKDSYLLSSSPERFLKKSGNRLLSQPIKGTARRGENLFEDEQLKSRLHFDEKERNENVMIVDLVRNDLSRSAIQGSVKVEELYGVYTFRQVHQMISSVSAELKEGFHFIDAIKNAFPMGSMTGAPKVKAMELIEQYESTKRGLYSGAVGYITPSGDFDFNVVIRSILYNASDKYLSFMVGSAITSRANAEQEYDECLLKANAMLEVLGAHHLEPGNKYSKGDAQPV
ncbi:MAG: anthranilate synthase component I family protein [Bacteroidetes bacterium]|nr:anthranilate synthase component I family protein [Bacteroidota bacterium]